MRCPGCSKGSRVNAEKWATPAQRARELVIEAPRKRSAVHYPSRIRCRSAGADRAGQLPNKYTTEEHMDQRRKITLGAGGLALAFALGVAVGQGTAPTENKGVKVGAPTTLDLAQEVEGVEGRQLRMRVVTVEPGGVVGVHSHKGRPAVAHVLQGTLTEHRE